MKLPRAFLALLIAATTTVAPPSRAADPPAEPAAAEVTIVNSDADGNQVSRFDVNGDGLDAHDGSIIEVDGTFYLYGTSYGCGYQYQVNDQFCGFKVYSSPDLVHWTDRGYVVPPRACGACFRPHVIYNAREDTYVLWADEGGKYGVYTSKTPTGRFTPRPTPAMNVPRGVDMTLFVDDDPNATAYVIHNTALVPGTSPDTTTMVVEKLTPNYQSTVSGAFVELTMGNVEAFAAVKRNGTYHLLMSDPTCAYCAAETGELTTTNLLAPQSSWQGIWYDSKGWNVYEDRPQPRNRSRIVNPDSCGGQPIAILPIKHSDGSTGYYFVSDRWNHRSPNEALANLYIGPMTFDSSGRLNDIQCVNSFKLWLPGPGGSYNVSPEVDANSGFDGFRHHCEVANTPRQQSFTAQRSGILTAASITTFKGGSPNAPLKVELLRDSTVLSTTTFAPENVPSAPTTLTIRPNVAVTAGQTYILRLRSTSHYGCYGVEYSDANPYPGGAAGYSRGGNLYTVETNRDLKFTTSVGPASPLTLDELPAGYTRCAGEAETCSFTGRRVLAYGAGVYRTTIANGPAACSLAELGGDPAVGVLKSCYLAPVGGPPGWTQCATEGGGCAVTGPTMVAYGANGAFNYRLRQAGTVPCGVDEFGGDPIFGVVKSCYTAPAGAPAGWAQCAADGGTCAVTGNQVLAFGGRGAFVTKRTAFPVACTAASFGGDPIAGVAKACYKRVLGAPVGFSTKCAGEGGTCTFAGQRTVAYGEAGNFAYRTHVGSVGCGRGSFGRDPLFGVLKSCYLTP